MDETITKRIHISGLTPAITAKDLSDRLSSFGTVKSIDGFGLLDAVGQPRKFAYATLETTKGKLARCMNLLSGVTWKGAKLRLGEAKPDFRERILKEHADLKRAAEEESERPKKRRRLRGVQGVHAQDMSLVTPENVSDRGGWRVAPTGRLIRPMRMRPSHPLPEPLDVAKKEKGKTKPKKDEKSRKRVRDPPTRARRQTIDPTKWGSQHLKGIFLENAAAFVPTSKPLAPEIPLAIRDNSEDDEGSDSPTSESDDDSEKTESSSVAADEPSPPARTTSVLPPAPLTSHKPHAPPSSVAREIAEEKSQSLGLLQSLFGDKEDWGGAESIGSDVEDDIEYTRANTAVNPSAADEEEAEDTEGAMDVDEQQPRDSSPAPESAPVPTDGTKVKLKDLFAPREDEGGFSLLGHLDLDLELEDDVPYAVAAPSSAPAPSASHRPLASAQPQPISFSTPTIASLDISRAFFFPAGQLGTGARRRVLDPTDWRSWFHRTDTPEAIRARWEETKGELTAGWKRRHREAVKSRRRRGGGGDADL